MTRDGRWKIAGVRETFFMMEMTLLSLALRAVRVLLDGTPQHRCGQIAPYDHADTTGIQSKHRGVARAATHVEHNGIDRNIMDAHSVRAMSCGWR